MRQGDKFMIEGSTLVRLTGPNKGRKRKIIRFDPTTFTITLEPSLLQRILHFIYPLWNPMAGTSIKAKTALSKDYQEDCGPNVDTSKMKKFTCIQCKRTIHYYPCAFCTSTGPCSGNDSDAKVEQLRVQLAGCSVAATSSTKDIAKRGMYGWSPAYQDVIELRMAYDELVKKHKTLQRNVKFFNGFSSF